MSRDVTAEQVTVERPWKPMAWPITTVAWISAQSVIEQMKTPMVNSISLIMARWSPMGRGIARPNRDSNPQNRAKITGFVHGQYQIARESRKPYERYEGLSGEQLRMLLLMQKRFPTVLRKARRRMTNLFPELDCALLREPVLICGRHSEVTGQSRVRCRCLTCQRTL